MRWLGNICAVAEPSGEGGYGGRHVYSLPRLHRSERDHKHPPVRGKGQKLPAPIATDTYPSGERGSDQVIVVVSGAGVGGPELEPTGLNAELAFTAVGLGQQGEVICGKSREGSSKTRQGFR